MKNINKISFFLMISILIMFVFSTVTFADPTTYFTDSALAGTETSDSTLTDSTANLTENGIRDAAQNGDGAGTSYRNLGLLNKRIGKLWDFFRWGIGILCAFGTISSFFILTKSFLQLAWLPDHPAQRRKTYVDILTSGVCTILFGGLSLILTIFYKSFQEMVMSNALYTRDYKSAFALFIIEYKYMIAGADAILVLTLIILLIKDILELAMSGGNPRKREEAVRSLLFTILGIVGAGGVGLIIGLFTGLLN